MTDTAVDPLADPSTPFPIDALTADLLARDRFVRPSLLWYVAFDGGIATLGAMSASQGVYDAVSGISPAPVPSRRVVQALFAGSLLLHVAESKYAYSYAKRQGMPRSALRYGVHTLVVGFPAILKLRAQASA